LNLPFDTDQYVKVRAPVVDEFRYSGGNAGATISADINKAFLDRVASNMNTKFARTGDLAPVVIGHTVTGAPETEQPPVVGYLHNYAVEPFDDRTALYADYWIRKENKLKLDNTFGTYSAQDIISRFPRRSGEVWLNHAEVDPVSLLGATTPHRSLGLLKLAADGDASLGFTSPGDLKMPDAAPPAQTGDFAKLQATVEQTAAMVGQLMEMIQSALAQGAHEQQPGGGDEHDLDKFLEGLDGGGDEEEGGEKKEPKEKPEAAEKKEPKEGAADDEKVKLARERDEYAAKFARLQVTTKLENMRAAGVDVDPADEQTIQDLMVQPPDMRERTLARLQRGARRLPGSGGGFGAAVNEATADNGKRISTVAQKDEVMKLARKENISFEQAARKSGYTL
jgi:hypothetical protein